VRPAHGRGNPHRWNFRIDERCICVVARGWKIARLYRNDRTKRSAGEERCTVCRERCAALRDPRFPPLRAEEVESVEIEVSVLSPLRAMQVDEIEIGKHGLLIEKGRQRGLLLPQVATEHGLDRERFLEETCRKAGLPREAWKSAETAIFGFTCEIVGKPAE
jgi:AMMECR1